MALDRSRPAPRGFENAGPAAQPPGFACTTISWQTDRMKQPALLWPALALWAALFAAAFVVPALMPATGDGFTRGLNRVSAFLGWQAAAGAVAFLVWLLGNRAEPGTLARRLSRVPLGIVGLGFAAILGLVLWANLSKPDPAPAPNRPTTAPVDEAAPALPLPE